MPKNIHKTQAETKRVSQHKLILKGFVLKVNTYG